MKLLGIDSSGLVASVAVLEDDVIIGEYTTNFKKTHSQRLLPSPSGYALLRYITIRTSCFTISSKSIVIVIRRSR